MYIFINLRIISECVNYMVRNIVTSGEIYNLLINYNVQIINDLCNFTDSKLLLQYRFL